MRRLAEEISAAYDHGLVLVAVLKGSVPFLADMIREMSIVPEVDFMSISSYAPESGRVRIIKDMDLLLVEYALRTVLADEASMPLWAYQTANRRVGKPASATSFSAT